MNVDSEAPHGGDQKAIRDGRRRSAHCRETVRGVMRISRQSAARTHHLVQGKATAEENNGK